MAESNPELESFRQDWKAEVAARSTRPINQSIPWKSSSLQSSIRAARRPPVSSTRRLSKGQKSDTRDSDEEEAPDAGHPNVSPPPSTNDIQGFGDSFGAREPQSALEHYEKAVESEDQGKLGDSLSLYRKAYRMDHRVDVAYKNKHHPQTAKPKSVTAETTAPADDVKLSAKPSNVAANQSQTPQSYAELVESFASLAIVPAAAEIEGTPASPCPIANLPDELIMNILTHLAVIDVAAYARSAQVCKRLAYLVANEEQPWKRICLGSEVGFAAMRYQWQTEIQGGPLQGPPTDDFVDSDTELEVEKLLLPNDPMVTKSLLASVYASSWRHMFRHRPRIRFNGCYISTVNYMRPGQASTNQLTWNSPVHIVTYYRYLRFYRDGTVLSLCTTSEPSEVIPLFTKEALLQSKERTSKQTLPKNDSRQAQSKNDSKQIAARNIPKQILSKNDPIPNGQPANPNGTPAQPAQPSTSVLNACHRGRWRLSTGSDLPDADLKDVESEVYVETEGVGTKYIYRMELSLRSVGKGARNNKLAWKTYWHYNRLTDDWGEFGLKNDKAFFWSRVKSWGMGE